MKVLTVIALLIFSHSSITVDRVFKADYRNRPPQMVVENNQFSGPLIDILDEASAKMGYRVDWRFAPFKRSSRDLEFGLVDIVPRYFWTPERATFTNYLGPIGYQEQTMNFVVLEENRNIIQSYDDLYKYKVGLKRGTSYFKKFNEDNKIEKVETTDDDQIVKMLQGRRFEVAIIIDGKSFEYAAKKAKFSGWVYAPYSFIKRFPNYYGMSKKSPRASAYEELNHLLREMSISGRVEEIYMKYNVSPPIPVEPNSLK